MLAAARASGLDVPEVDPATQKMAEAMLRNFAGRKPTSDENAQGEELALEVPILGVIRERIEGDGFEVWEDSFTMQTDVFFAQGFAEELFTQVPSNVTRGYNLAAIEIDVAENVEGVEKALKKEGYRSMSIDTILDRVENALAVITTVVSALTMIALLVAVLGIVNTMVMNVSERTREIGVLKALGGTNGQIRALFLVESSLIGLAGGLTGLAASLAASIVGDWWHRHAVLALTQYEFPGSVFSFPPWLLALAMTFAVGLSVLAALGPATRASRVDPVTALRDE